MHHCYWCNQCPYVRQCSRVNYPVSEYPDGYMTPLPEYYDRVNFNIDAEEMAGVNTVESVENIGDKSVKPLGVQDEEIMKKQNRGPQDVTRVVGIINQSAMQEFEEIIRIGMDRKLLDYVIRTLVQYIDKNYERYQGTNSRKVEMTIFDIKRDLTWLFDILRIYHVSPATENRLLDKVASESMQNLQPKRPSSNPNR